MAASSRRGFLQLAAAGACGASACGWLDAVAAQAAAERGRYKSCIVLFMDGGPSHKDTFDLKPGTENSGPLLPIATSVPGILISELFPKFARQMQHAAIIRGMSTQENDHFRARYHLHTGYRQRVGGLVYPAFGALAAHEATRGDSTLPPYVLSMDGGGRTYGTASGFLGPKFQPLTVKNAARGLENSTASSAAGDFNAQFDLLVSLEQDFQQRYNSPAARAHATTVQRAARLMKDDQLKAFDLSAEPAAAREAYGGTPFGDSCLLARRLVEAAVPFIEVNSGGWDQHGRIYTDARRGIRPLSAQVDTAMSALVADLSARGLLDSTLVVWMGEFGRTPNLNKGLGRDHYSKAWSTVLIGGGIKGGQAIGRTDSEGATVEDRPVTVIDFYATVCKVLGIDANKQLPSPGNRPIPIVDNQSQQPRPIAELLG